MEGAFKQSIQKENVLHPPAPRTRWVLPPGFSVSPGDSATPTPPPGSEQVGREQGGPHLPLGEPQRGSQLSFPPDGNVATIVKLLLQLQPLVVRVHDPVFVLRPGFHWRKRVGLRTARRPISHR